MRKKKVLYRLDTGTEEAKQMYNTAKLEAKNDDWVQLGRNWRKMLKGISEDFGLG